MESRISIVLSSLINNRLQTGFASTVIPTAAGMAMRREKRIAVAMRSSFSFLFRLATALVKDGIRDEDNAFDTATGMLKSSWYCPSTPQ